MTLCQHDIPPANCAACRDALRNAPRPRRGFNSTVAASDKPISQMSAKQRKRLSLDSEIAEVVKGRDAHICIACKWLWRRDRDCNVVHHIARKKTHKGGGLRDMTGYQIALCNECHQDEHAQNGYDRKLFIEVVENGDMVTHKMWQTVNKEYRACERPAVSNYNPLEQDE